MIGKSREILAERIRVRPKQDKLDLFLAALSQPEIQIAAQRVREYLFSHKRATERIKSLNKEILRIKNTLGSSTYKFSETQRKVFEDLIEANRAECRKMVLVRRGKDLGAGTRLIAAMAQDMAKERPSIELEDWPYEVGIILANIGDLKSTSRFIKRIKELFEAFSTGRQLSGDEKKFLVALAALYRQLS